VSDLVSHATKESGFEYIKEVPNSWSIIPAQYLFSEAKEKNCDNSYNNAFSFKYGEIVPKTVIGNEDAELDETYSVYTVVEPNTIILNGLNLNYDFVTQRVAVVRERGIITSAYLAVYPDLGRMRADFACYLFKAFDAQRVFHNMGTGLRKTLKFADFKKCPVLVPTLQEQDSIMSHLSGKLSRIDSMIADAKVNIGDYKLLKQSIITQAVTKGLDPNVPMKDSGVEWIGKIPEKWQTFRGKWIMTLLSRPICDSDEIITCFRDGQVTLRKNRREDGFTFADKELGYQGVEPGDLVVHGMDGFAGSIGISDSRGKSTPVLLVLDSKQCKRYLMYFLRSMAYGGVFLGTSTGIRVRTCALNWNKLGNLIFPVPPIEKQLTIADYIDKELESIDSIISEQQSLIDDLVAAKKSLIYECVTGKRKVG